jgi:hypothetical protein
MTSQARGTAGVGRARLAVAGFASAFVILLAEPAMSRVDERPIAMVDRWHTGLEYVERGNYAAALPVLEDLSIRGKSDAMLMAGTMYWLGQGAEVDRSRGYALVKLAAESGQAGAASQEQKMATQLTGKELIDADRKIDGYRNATADFKQREQGLALELLGVTVDPAATPSLDKDCTGLIPTLEAKPTSIGEGAKIRMLPFPAGVVLADREATIKIALHVGRSGAVCKSVALERSRRPDLDDAAVYGSQLWTLSPAQLHGKSVESVHIMAVTFRR